MSIRRRKSGTIDPLSGLYIVEGREAVLALEPLLQRLAQRCDQPCAMHWLSYFLGGSGAKWKQPCLLLALATGANLESLQPDDLCGAALFYELGAFRLRTGAFATDDWDGLRTVIAPQAMRGQLAARAIQALVGRGAHLLLATYRDTPHKPDPGAMPQQPDVLWTESVRVTRHLLALEETYEQTLAKFGKRTRTNLRYYRKRLLARVQCEFLEDAHAVANEAELLRMNAISLNPVPEEECRRRYHATRDLPGGFLIGLRKRDGHLLSVLGGWRQGTATVMHHQMNVAGFEKDSLNTVMRAFFLEREIARGTREVIFYHGTNHSISHAFEAGHVRDLVVRRDSLRARLLVRLAAWLAPPHYYSNTNYFGGSTTFFAGALTNDAAVWHSV